MLQKRLVVFRFTVPVENPDIGIPKSASCKGESSMFALPDSVLDGRTGFSSAAPVTQTNGICKIIVQTKSPTKPTALWREHNFGVAGQTV